VEPGDRPDKNVPPHILLLVRLVAGRPAVTAERVAAHSMQEPCHLHLLPCTGLFAVVTSLLMHVVTAPCASALLRDLLQRKRLVRSPARLKSRHSPLGPYSVETVLRQCSKLVPLFTGPANAGGAGPVTPCPACPAKRWVGTAGGKGSQGALQRAIIAIQRRFMAQRRFRVFGADPYRRVMDRTEKRTWTETDPTTKILWSRRNFPSPVFGVLAINFSEVPRGCHPYTVVAAPDLTSRPTGRVPMSSSQQRHRD
jgi:hypothetical protein